MRLPKGKRKRVAEVFGNIAQHTITILFLGAVLAQQTDFRIYSIALVLFCSFLSVALVFEPAKVDNKFEENK